MKTILAAVVTALALGVSPAWAGGGHGHGKHASKHMKKAHKHWAKHHDRHVEEHVIVHQYYEPAPRVVYQRVVVAPPAPPPGVHVVMPNIYIPL